MKLMASLLHPDPSSLILYLAMPALDILAVRVLGGTRQGPPLYTRPELLSTLSSHARILLHLAKSFVGSCRRPRTEFCAPSGGCKAIVTVTLGITNGSGAALVERRGAARRG